MNRSDNILKILNTIFSALLLIGLVIAYQSFKESHKLLEATNKQLDADHDQRRRIYTMHLYDVWREVFAGSTRITLEKVRSGEITEQELFLIAKNGKPIARKFTQQQVYEIRADIVRTLNLFEQIAVAYRDGVADQDMIKNYFKDPIIKNRRRLLSFVDGWVTNEYRGGWPPLDKVITEDWKEEIGKKPPLPGSY